MISTTALLVGIATALIWYLIGKTTEQRRQARAKVSPEEAWDNGCQHGLRLAHDAVTTYPKPWINFGEERGWDLARHQLAEVIASYLPEETLTNETNPTAPQAAKRGVS